VNCRISLFSLSLSLSLSTFCEVSPKNEDTEIKSLSQKFIEKLNTRTRQIFEQLETETQSLDRKEEHAIHQLVNSVDRFHNMYKVYVLFRSALSLHFQFLKFSIFVSIVLFNNIFFQFSINSWEQIPFDALCAREQSTCLKCFKEKLDLIACAQYIEALEKCSSQFLHKGSEQINSNEITPPQ
jgi:hypothetical protein